MGWIKRTKRSKETKRKISNTLMGHEVSEETKRKISKANKGKTHSDETKRKMSRTRKGVPSPLLGKPQTDKVRKKRISAIKKAIKGKKQKPEHIKKRVESRLKNGNYKHSEEAKRKISKTKKGTKLSEETKRKISIGNKGKIISEEQKAIISKARKGRTMSEAQKRKISKTLTGRKLCRRSNKNHWNWQGGISKHGYCDAWSDKEYKEAIKERDNYKCQNPECWGIKCILSIHHINYNKEDCHPSNLITLCLSCNTRANFNKDKWGKLFKKIIRNKGGD